MSDTKYGHLIGDDHSWDDEDDEVSVESRVTLQHQTVTLLWGDEPRDLEYRAVISHGSHSWEPICTHVRRAHRIGGSNQFDPMGTVGWTDLPREVQQHVVDVVAGVDAVEELDPEHEIGFNRDGGGA